MRVMKIGDWSLARRILSGASRRVKDAIDKAVLQEAQFFRTKIVEGLRRGAPGGQALQPLAPTTLAIRRFRGFKGSKPLIVHGDLWNSIAVVKQADRVFVGVLRTAKSKGGQSLVNTAAIHEFGSRAIAVKLTPKMRRFLHAALRSAGLDARQRSVLHRHRGHPGPSAPVSPASVRGAREPRGRLAPRPWPAGDASR